MIGIVLRPARGVEAMLVHEAQAIAGLGLAGDRRAAVAPRTGGAGRKRALSMIQAEHLPMIARWCDRDSIDARVFRRNLVVEGINLIAMRSPFADQPAIWHIGDEVLIEVTGPCDPCSKMEDALGPGAYNAMRGHGGVTASILRGGRIAIGDPVLPAEQSLVDAMRPA